MADLKIAPEEIFIWGLDPFPEGEDHSDLADPERLALPVSEELIESIDKAGVVVPIMVRAVKASKWRTFRGGTNDRAYIAIDGRQRIRAARAINARRKDNFPVLIPYVIRELSDEIAALAPGIANAGRQDDSPLACAHRIVRLQNRGYKLADMRHAFQGNPSVQTLTNYLALLKVVPELSPKLGTEITWSDGYALGKMKPEEQRAAVKAPKLPEILESFGVAVTPQAEPVIVKGIRGTLTVEPEETPCPPTPPAPRLPSQRAAARPSLAALKSVFSSLEPGELEDPDHDMDLAAEVLRFVITGAGDFSRWPTVAGRIK